MLKKIFYILLIIAVLMAFFAAGLYFWFKSGGMQKYVLENYGKPTIKNDYLYEVIYDGLGFEQEKHILILFLNNTELRPGGGFIGSYATIRTDKGTPHLLKVEGTEILDNNATSYLQTVPPKPIKDYLGVEKWFFRDSNWSPDFSVSAVKALELYTAEKGVAGGDVDYVIGITPNVVREILKITGPMSVGGMEFNADNFIEKLQWEVEYGYTKQGLSFSDRKKALQDLTRAILLNFGRDFLKYNVEFVDLTKEMLKEKQIVIYGDYVFVGHEGNGLKILNIANPYAPESVSSFTEEAHIYDVKASGDYVYLASSTSGLIIVDVKDPANPTRVGSYGAYNTTGFAKTIDISGSYAFVGFDKNISQGVSSSLRIIDISSSTNPAPMGSYNLGIDQLEDVFVSGKYAFVGVSDGGVDSDFAVKILDISDLENPVLVGEYDTLISPRGLYVSGKYIYVADLTFGLQILEISSTELSALVAHSAEMGSLQIRNDLIARGKADLGYLTVGVGGILSNGSISISNTTSPNYFGGSVGVGTTNPLTKLHIDGGGLLVTGSAGATPVSGAGTRLMWVPEKGAFRAGAVTGDQWDEANIGDYSTAFGYNNVASNSSSFIGGGSGNTVSGFRSFIGGGAGNTVSGGLSLIIGGQSNQALEGYSSVIGGFSNIVSGENSSIIGGSFNEIATGTLSFIAGGGVNFVTGDYSAIIGGQENVMEGNYSFIGGGQNNTSTGNYSFIGGGGKNILNSERSFIGGGYENTILSSGDYSFIAGGQSNVVSNTHSFIAGGEGNIVGGKYSFIGAGKNSEVNGNYSAAFGYGIEVNGTSSFGFSLDNIGGYTIEGGSIMAIMGGKVGIGTTTPSSTFTVVGDTQLFGGFEVSPSSSSSTVKGWVSPDDGSWVNSSDEKLKKNIIDFTGSLDKVMSLRPVSYEFKNEKDAGGTTHIGLLAQELEQIFPQVVSTNKDGLKGVSYANLTPILVQAIQEQQEQIDAFKNASTTLTVENTEGQIVYTVDMGQDMLGRPLLNVALTTSNERIVT